MPTALHLLVLLVMLSGPAASAGQLPVPFPEQAFPIGVWLQQPRHAQRYRDLGINLYVGLWQGPTAAQLAALKHAGMPVICSQNDVGLSDPNRSMIVAWLQQDEPDNAQPLVGKAGLARLGWGSPISPEEMQQRYADIRRNDPGRPVYLNLGKGVAWDAWHGRGNRTRHPEDYPQYVKAGDIVSFDIYPAAETDPAIAGRLELVHFGTKRLRDWAGTEKPVWAAIGASRVNHPEGVVDAAVIRAQAWMSIIAGARGILYFVHQFKPRFVEASWFETPALASAIRDINARIQGLAALIQAPPSDSLLDVRLADGQGQALPADSLAVTTRRARCATYVFAASLARQPMQATFRFKLLPGGAVEVLDEARSLRPVGERLTDDFAPHAVHLYAIPDARCNADTPNAQSHN